MISFFEAVCIQSVSLSRAHANMNHPPTQKGTTEKRAPFVCSFYASFIDGEINKYIHYVFDSFISSLSLE